MASNAAPQEFVQLTVDLLQGVGPVVAKPMFGGFGVFLDGLMFGLIADNTLYLKVDDLNKPQFEELGLEPFTYIKNNKPMHMSYWQAPEECMESPQAMQKWGNIGFSAAIRAAAKKAKKANLRQ